MGKEEIYAFLKTNEGNWYTAEFISRELNCDTSNTHRILSKFVSDPIYRVFSELKQGNTKKEIQYYSFMDKDIIGDFNLILSEFKIIKNKHNGSFINSEVLSNILLAVEIRKLRGELKNARQKISK